MSLRILRNWYAANATFDASARKLTAKNAVGLCVVGMGASTSANCGTVITNMIHSASVCARCCNQAPFLMKNVGIVHASSSARPA